jgi:hypothetical protein
LSPPGYKKVIFGMLYVCVYAYIDVHVTSFWMVGRILFIFST